MYMLGVQTLRRRGEPNRLHVGEFVGKDSKDGGLLVIFVREVHVDRVCVEVWVSGRVYSREVLVLDEGRVCAGDRGVRARGLCRSWRGVGW